MLTLRCQRATSRSEHACSHPLHRQHPQLQAKNPRGIVGHLVTIAADRAQQVWAQHRFAAPCPVARSRTALPRLVVEQGTSSLAGLAFPA